MQHRLKKQTGFALIELIIIIGLLAVVGCVAWYAWHSKQASVSTPARKISTNGWKSYSNPCLHLTFKAPMNVPARYNFPKAGSCSIFPASQSTTNVNYWAMTIVDIGTPAVESLPKGPDISFDLPLPADNPIAMQFIGLHSVKTPSEALQQFKMANPDSALTLLGGHQAVIDAQVNPNQPPNNFRTVDTPYCPCTVETVLLDVGNNSVIQITGRWLNSDKGSADIVAGVIGSITF